MNNMAALSASKKTHGIESNLINSLRLKGYIHDFRLQQDHQLICIQNNKIFSITRVKVGLADLCYDFSTHTCKYIHTIDLDCGTKGLLVADKLFLPDKKTVGKVIEMYNNKLTRAELPSVKNVSQKKLVEDRMLVRFKDKIIPISFSDIALFYLEYELIQLVTLEGKCYFVQRSLEDLEKHLGANFYRVNRQALVNKSAIKDLSTTFTRTITVNLKCAFPGQIVVSKLKTSNFLDWLTLNPNV